MKNILPLAILLTAYVAAAEGSAAGGATARVGRPVQALGGLPEKYLRAFGCDFDEAPAAATARYHGTSAGRAERARDLTWLRPLGFRREGRDGDLPSAGGRIAAPAGMTVLGLPVAFLELNGLIGDANAMYVTTFDKGVTVDQVVRAARLTLDREKYRKYKARHFGRRIGSDPYVAISLNDRGGPNAVLTCQVQSTPD